MVRVHRRPQSDRRVKTKRMVSLQRADIGISFRRAARASEMEHAIKDEIHVRLDEDPAFYRSLRERLEQILEDYKAKRIDAAEKFKQCAAIATRMHDREGAAERLGLSSRAMAIYGLLTKPPTRGVSEPPGPGYVALDDAKKELATLIEEQLDAQTNIVDWVHKDDVQREMRRLIKRQLRAAGYVAEDAEPLAENVVDLMKRRSPR